MNTLQIPKKFSGKWFSPEDIVQINEMITSSPDAHRTTLSKMVCDAFGWYKINGGLKEMSCRVAMLRMDREGLIKLPAPTRKNGSASCKRTKTTEPQILFSHSIKELGPIRLELVKQSSSRLWNEYIDRYHYLGYNPLPGAQLRYFVYTGDRLLALLGFGASAWKTAPRDKYIGWEQEVQQQRLHLIVNNARFLILPWIQVPNLGSKILALVTKRLPGDWEERYHYRPLLLETFVEIGRFEGTCYLAANWICLGRTQGKGKKGTRFDNIPIKSVWVYPLDKNPRQKLCDKGIQ